MRGPIRCPMNFLMIQALATSAPYYGDSFTVECPARTGRARPLREGADELATCLTPVFVRDDGKDGRRAVFGDNEYFQNDPHWRDYIPFHEFFHGDTGAGLGAGHRTGWTALVALLLQYGGQVCFEHRRTDDGTRASAIQERAEEALRDPREGKVA